MKRFVLAGLMLLFARAAVCRGQEKASIFLPGKEALTDVIFSPKMDNVAVRFLDDTNRIKIYTFPAMKHLGDLEDPICPQATRFSPCGRYVALDAGFRKHGAVSLWDLDAKPPNKIRLLVQKTQPKDLMLGQIHDLRFSNDTKTLFGLDCLAIHVWVLQQSDKPVAELRGPFHRFLAEDTLIAVRGDAKKELPEIDRFDATGVRTLRRIDPRIGYLDGAYFTPDGKYALAFDGREGDGLILDLQVPGSKLVGKFSADWIANDPDTSSTRRYHRAKPAITPDLSLLVGYYEIADGMVRVRQGIGFFPRDQAKAKEFGLDLKKHSHLFLPVAKAPTLSPSTVISPDGRWVAVTEVVPPRIWPIENLGKLLLAEKGIEMR